MNHIFFFKEKDGTEKCSRVEPEWDDEYEFWSCLEEMANGDYWDVGTTLPNGSIEKITNKKIKWNESPIRMDF